MTAVTRAQAPVEIEGDGLEVRIQDLGDGMSVAFLKLPRGIDMTPALKGLPDEGVPGGAGPHQVTGTR
ncbi:hypothetical protein AB0G86_27785 [Streptomyces scabiei]|uniref:hypothetical protein n=1 Tax=Streptomyces scabiei TaxID=1930 RepID=UPI0033D9E86C